MLTVIYNTLQRRSSYIRKFKISNIIMITFIAIKIRKLKFIKFITVLMLSLIQHWESVLNSECMYKYVHIVRCIIDSECGENSFI